MVSQARRHKSLIKAITIFQYKLTIHFNFVLEFAYSVILGTILTVIFVACMAIQLFIYVLQASKNLCIHFTAYAVSRLLKIQVVFCTPGYIEFKVTWCA